MHKNKFLEGALYLSLAGVISKVLSAMYRVPLQNLTGDLGFYTYQQIYPLIGIVMILGLYGFPQAISKLIAEATPSEKSQLRRPIFLSLYLINGSLALLFLLFSGPFARLMADESLVLAYRFLSLVFLLLPLLSYLRGKAQGEASMIPTAVSQVAEQITRVVIIVVSAYLIFMDKLPLASIGLFAVYASIFSMLIAIIILWLISLGKKKKRVQQGKSYKFKYVFKNILFLGLLGASTHMILLWLQVVDVFSIVPSLLKTEMNLDQARALKGIFDRGQPLIQFGVVIGSSFALALIPSVVKTKQIKTNAVTEALTFGFYLAGAATVGLFILMPEVNKLLFMDTSGTLSLRLLALSIFFTTLTITLGTVIQTAYSMLVVTGYLFITVAIKYILNLWLVVQFGIVGSALATVLSLAILTLLLMYKLKQYMPQHRFFKQINYQAFILGLSLMTVVLFSLKWWLTPVDFSRYLLAITIFFLIFIGIIIYLAVLLKYRVFSMKQLQVLPLGEKLIVLMEKFEKK